MINLYQGDCLELLKGFPDNSVDLVVTSPPYDNLRNYEGSLSFTLDTFKAIAGELSRVLMPGRVIVWIVADSTVNGSESGTSFKQALYFKEIGLNIHDTMIWAKGTSPFQHKNRYISSFEYMFIFSKGSPKTYNLISDRKNKWGGTKVHGTERQVDGTTKPFSKIQTSKLIKEYGARINIWEINPEKTLNKEHPAVFPIHLVKDHIITWSNPNDVVLDPFMGSGTTGVACKETGREFVGIELVSKYFEIAKKRTA